MSEPVVRSLPDSKGWVVQIEDPRPIEGSVVHELRFGREDLKWVQGLIVDGKFANQYPDEVKLEQPENEGHAHTIARPYLKRLIHEPVDDGA